MAFSHYIIYADESGSPVLTADAGDFPVFVLVFLIVHKDHYVHDLVPKLQMLKFDFVGHDQLILHERDIRRQSGAFAFLQRSDEVRNGFIERTTSIIKDAEITICATIIDKAKLAETYSDPWSPYDLALTFCIERAARFLRERKQDGTEVKVVFEARGSKEDMHLGEELQRVVNGKPKVGLPDPAVRKFTWQPMFVDKRANSSGLQIADLAARPLGLAYLRPDQTNRAADVLKAKLLWNAAKCFP
jgi:hypothetical protein